MTKVTRHFNKIIITISILISLLIIAPCIFLIALFGVLSQPSKDLIVESTSPEGKYTVKAYLYNYGATVDYVVRCELFDKNGKKMKVIYDDYHIKDAKIIWIDNNTVVINGHKIMLPYGKYDWRSN